MGCTRKLLRFYLLGLRLHKAALRSGVLMSRRDEIADRVFAFGGLAVLDVDQ
jgi:hypothetical protein